MKSRSLYIATTIHADLDSVWEHTQKPELHERWDLRFSSIRYLPKSNPEDQQCFEYSRRIAPGILISGWGKSVATKTKDGSSTSSLKFGSDMPISLIREGSGYWKYTPDNDSILFETGYDYSVRWGLLGRIIDSLVFRPLIGFATAWSFDRLKLWIEEGVDPTLSILRATVHSISRLTLALVFLWHGLVPKLLMRHPDELRLIEASGFSQVAAQQMLILSGWLEVVYAFLLLVLWNARWLYVFTAAVLLVLLLAAIRVDQSLLAHPFTPITLTASLLAVCLVGWVSCDNLPRASSCARKKARVQSRRS